MVLTKQIIKVTIFLTYIYTKTYTYTYTYALKELELVAFNPAEGKIKKYKTNNPKESMKENNKK